MKCAECGSATNLKRGWTNKWYCSESCERTGVSRLHGSMPGGRLPRPGWLPHQISREISERWDGGEE